MKQLGIIAFIFLLCAQASRFILNMGASDAISKQERNEKIERLCKTQDNEINNIKSILNVQLAEIDSEIQKRTIIIEKINKDLKIDDPKYFEILDINSSTLLEIKNLEDNKVELIKNEARKIEQIKERVASEIAKLMNLTAY